MNTIKHTPGPFTTQEFSTGEFKYTPHIDIIGKDGQYVAEVPLCTPAFSGTEEMLVERRANAALIAAAPELLEALKPFIEVWNLGGSSWKDQLVNLSYDTFNNARNAIAKAEGRS